MSSTIGSALLWAAALSSGLMAGVYFAFSAFIMRALSNIEPVHAINAMNSINQTILRSLFMPLFFGSSIISVLLMIMAMINWGEGNSEFTLIAGLTYFAGMFACTVLFNVPLNNSLVTLQPDSADAYQVWFNYLKTWSNWNHLRTISSLISCIICVWLLSDP